MRGGKVRAEWKEQLTFYVALETSDRTVQVLWEIARELVDAVRPNVTIDWAHRESVWVFLRSRVRRILRKYGYPPDKKEKAIQTVLE